MGFTLVEMLMGVAIISIVAVALLGAFLGQSYLSTHARNLTAAMSDATRIMEQIRLQNASDREPCKTRGIPTAVPVDALGASIATSWNSWLEGQEGGKTVNIALSAAQRNGLELVAVTCQDGASAASIPPYCGTNQVGSKEWKFWLAATQYNPIRVVVAVGWRQNARAIGGTSNGQEFLYTGTMPDRRRVLAGWLTGIDELLVPAAEAWGGQPLVGQWRVADTDGDGVIESQAMLTTFITCR